MTTIDSSLPSQARRQNTTEANEAPMGLFEVERDFQFQTEEEKPESDVDSDNEQEISIEEPQHAIVEEEGTAEGTPEKITFFQPLSSFKLNHNAITIKVLNPKPKDGKFDKYVIYTIKGHDREGNFEIERTQRQFFEIRALLVARWPGCYIPATPPKRMMTKCSTHFLELRRKQYEMFCQKVAELPYLHYSAEYQLFLRSPSSDLTFELSRFPRTDYVEIMSRFDMTFDDAIQREVTNKIIEKIEHFRDFLAGTREHFQKYKKILKNIAKARRKYLGQFSHFQDAITTDFQAKILKGYEDSRPEILKAPDNLSFAKTESTDKVRVNSLMDPIDFLHAWIKTEENETEGFLESIRQRDNLIALRGKLLEKQKSKARDLDKIVNGAITFKTLFTTKGRAVVIDTMEKQIANFNKEVELLKMVIEKVTLILAYSEIEKFRRDKSEQYHHVMTMAAHNEIFKLREMNEFWKVLIPKGEFSKNFSDFEPIKKPGKK